MPPFCVELVMGDGSRYSLHSVLEHDESAGTAVLQVWDFHLLSDEELEAVRQKLRDFSERGQLADPAVVHEKMRCARLRLRTGDIGHCVESADPLWPAASAASARGRRTIGFQPGTMS